MHNKARLIANQVAEAIVRYEQAHGTYAATIEEAGALNKYARTNMML